MANVAFRPALARIRFWPQGLKPVARWAVWSEDAVKGNEFVKRVYELAAERGVAVRLDYRRGKGSHATLYFGDRKTVLKDRRKEIPPGLLSAMIRQLDLQSSDFP